MRKSIALLFFLTIVVLQAWSQSAPSPPANPAPVAASTAQSPSTTAPATSTTEPPAFFLDKFQEFSAIMVGGPAPGADDSIHIYRSGDLMRMEANGGKSFQVTNLSKRENHSVSRAGCLKTDKAYLRSYPFSMSQRGAQVDRQPAGEETVDGHPCHVEDVTTTIPGHSEPTKIRMWEADDLDGFPIKVEAKAHRVIQYKNVKLGPQDPTIFIVPEECQAAKSVGATPTQSRKPAASTSKK